MGTASATTLLKWTSKYSADSVEWCPIEGYHNILVCGTYQLLKDEEGEERTRDQRKLGELYLFSITSDTVYLDPIQTIETSAILDQKWCDNPIDGFPHLAVANAAGFLQIYKLINQDIYSLHLVTEFKLNPDVKNLALSVDWSNRKYSSNTPKIVVSDSLGGISVISFESGNLVKDTSWKAHDFEAWICAFDCWDPTVIVTGGDDCKMKVFDLRSDSSARKINRSYEAGVTSLHFNTEKEHLFASGSYDEKLRLWDMRKLNSPVEEINLGGGIWRLKWDPFEKNILLAACMYGGFRIVDCKEISSPKIIGEYNEHQSIAYGSDWCYDNSLFKATSDSEFFYGIIATCSFYDCKMDVVEIKY